MQCVGYRFSLHFKHSVIEVSFMFFRLTYHCAGNRKLLVVSYEVVSA